ncbi:Protein phosphatase 2C 32 [Apostasia shenzhenica]|uniref:protein-serine/threonine phosphatase n=1 Tax=Apostasia shenzhenica TaxID=1088818 RepID=A0A2I0AGI4_9ASPA|nr:Protein phosphatase 2C 32 [Apostasia shenzhenica]
MGNSTSRVVGCFAPFNNGKDGVNLEFLEPLDEGLGHSFCYVRPVIVDSPAITPSTSERYTAYSSTLDSETHSGSFRQEVVVEDVSGQQRHNSSFPETTFKTISGASVSANASSARTGGNLHVLLAGEAQQPAASFESTASFSAIPLQPVPRGSGPLNGFMSGPLERGFASGPLERGSIMSGPLEKGLFMSGPLDGTDTSNFSAPLAYCQRKMGIKRLVRSMSRPMRSALSRTFTKRWSGSGWMQRFFSYPMTQLGLNLKEAKSRQEAPRNSAEVGASEPEYSSMRNLQWAHGKAGEDRVHVVLSEEQGWLFVGIYDGFSGPDAPDFLMSNLYKAIDKELEGLLWDYEDSSQRGIIPAPGYGSGSEECVLPKEHNGSTGTQISGSQVCVDYCLKEVPLVFLSEQHIGRREPSVGDELGREPMLGHEILYGEVGSVNADRDHIASTLPQDGDSELDEKNVDAHGGASNQKGKDADYTPMDISLRQPRNSKRLYELLQMELMEDSKVKEETCATASFRGDLCDIEHKAQSYLVSRSTNIEVLRSGQVEGSGGLRESECLVEEEFLDLKQQPVAPFSTFGQNQMMNRLLIGPKSRKTCRKKKSLRKKLFPWSYDWHRDQHHLAERIGDPSVTVRRCKTGPVDHDAVLKAMERALQTTEEAYADMVEKALDRNPELALMGSCVLVMLMKDQDVYVMNLGDSRVVLAQNKLNDRHGNSNPIGDDSKFRNRSRESLVRVELDRISEESPMHNQNSHVCILNKNREISLYRLKMRAVQLSTDHSTSIEEEVQRIKAEHADDPQGVFNDRVKGQLKVTRAFGAEFLKQPRFNDALLEMFRIDYVGASPYLSCIPSVLHHRLCSNDLFLVLSSDGLYQYFSNEEVISHVAWFMENMPEGDPAQYLIAELLFRAAKKNGMDFHQLLDIPHGDRRKYHDDVSVMVISLEGRIWRSSG